MSTDPQLAEAQDEAIVLIRPAPVEIAARGLWSFVRGTVLNLAAVGGVLCIIAVGSAYFLHISLILFKTGSMTPTIPAGSVALVREVPVSDVVIGDVVTVDRPGLLPITHRVIEIEPTAGGMAYLTLRGDANPSPDPAPYLVGQVRRVMASAPGLAAAIVTVSNRWVMVTVTLLVSLLVTWTFWPRTETSPDRGRHRVR